jgi:peroxiredoxin Q/BCP
MAIRVGRRAPTFALPDANGDTVVTTKFLGKDLVIFFYPKDNTPACTKEACGFRDVWDEFQQLGVVLLGVSPDSERSHQKFAADHQLPFPLLSDPKKVVLKPYGAFGEKMMYGKKVQGVIRSTVWIGPDGKVKKRWAKVAKAETHPAQVLAALMEAR